MEKLKLYNMVMDCEQTDAYNSRRSHTIKEKRERFDSEYHQENFKRWIRQLYTDKYINLGGEYNYKIILNLIDDIDKILKNQKLKLNTNVFKNNAASYIYNVSNNEF